MLTISASASPHSCHASKPMQSLAIPRFVPTSAFRPLARFPRTIPQISPLTPRAQCKSGRKRKWIVWAIGRHTELPTILSLMDVTKKGRQFSQARPGGGVPRWGFFLAARP